MEEFYSEEEYEPEEIDDFEEFDEFKSNGPEFVMGYREAQERGRGGAEIMETQIEGRGSLARAQERLQSRINNPADKKLNIFYRQISDLYKRFAPNDEVLILDEFHSLPNQTYKNPYAFLLGYIGIREGKLTKNLLKTLMDYARETNVLNLSEPDIIRYYRLLERIRVNQISGKLLI